MYIAQQKQTHGYRKQTCAYKFGMGRDGKNWDMGLRGMKYDV